MTNEQPRRVVLSHGSCPDGHMASWIAWHNWGEVNPTLIPMNYGDPVPPECDGADVLILDWCFPNAELRQLADMAETVLILDHHETAAHYVEDSGYHVYDSFETWVTAPLTPNPYIAVIDQSHSGAMLAQMYFGTDYELVQYVEDRDLWRFALPWTKDVFAAVTSRAYTVADYDELVFENSIDDLVIEGRAINRYRDQLIALAADGAFWVKLPAPPYDIQMAHCMYAIGSDVAGELAKEHMHGVGAYCVVQADGVKIGLRSTPEGMNVADLAGLLQPGQGGGHAKAAGCLVSHQEFAKWIS